ncbi:hypothetical protein L596_013328 [Steinernema carpocapsae]|uniref:CCHC-type domain-containing protein n=1 Tax=Steinernema carpocapsae TaxID=34508 RepID=A0A4U5NZW1_STECR|nr:hypothetical protein L596_013328 [Steinernema carpocapsae]
MELHRKLVHLRSPRMEVKELRKFSNQVAAIYSQMNATAANTGNVHLAQTILSKLPMQAKQRIAGSLTYATMHRVQTVIDKLDDIVNQMDVCNFTMEMTSSYSNGGSVTSRNQTLNNWAGRRYETEGPFSRSPRQAPNVETCVYCKQPDHNCQNCSECPNKASREAVLRNEKRCFNCLGQGHMLTACRNDGCRRCNKKHHPSLCRHGFSSEGGFPASGSSSIKDDQDLRDSP